MPGNVEIKARLTIDHARRVREVAMSRSTRGGERLHQVDTFYGATSGRLKLRRFGDGTAELIAYERADRAGPTHSSYVLYPCADPDTLHRALAMSVGVRGMVEKHREVIHVGQTRVHLDDVVGLGLFLELEVVLGDGQRHDAAVAVARELMDAFEIEPEMLVEAAYVDLLSPNEATETAP